MRNIMFILLTLLVAFTFASPEAVPEAAPEAAPGLGPNRFGADWGRLACKTRNANVQKAIEGYCKPYPGSGGRNVPGARGSKGTRVGNAVVSIDAGCNPGQWLPWDICFKQFYMMCASGFKGTGVRTYGRNGCQKWKITLAK